MAKEDNDMDSFDKIVNLETEFEKEGRQAAREAGAAGGLAYGRKLGWSVGTRVASEQEFYHGGAAGLIALSMSYGGLVNSKAKAVAQQIIEQCEGNSFAVMGNDENMEMEEELSKIRAMFKKMMAIQGLVGVRYDGVSSRMGDLSF